MSGTDRVAIVGIGIHPFGRTEGVSGRAQAVHATREALADAGITWEQCQFAFGGSRDAGSPDTLVADLGLTGLPFVNVWNGCATGGSALMMGDRMIRSGAADIGLVVGFDKHPKGAFNPDPEALGLGRWYAETGMMLTTQFFAMKIRRYMHDHGISASTLSRVAAKAFRNGALNPNAWRRSPLSEDDVAASAMVSDPLTQFMFCSPGEGAAALVLASASKARQLTNHPVFLDAVSFRTRRLGSFEVFSPSLESRRGDSPSVEAAHDVFERSGIGPEDVDVAQLQDTDSGAEVIHLAETGLCEHGMQEKLVQSGATEIGGSLPVNTDGGCLANGEPIGASGLRQVYESVLQLRGSAGAHQVPGSPSVAFTHVYGSPGVSACTLLSR